MPLCIMDNVPFSEMRGDNCHQGPRTVCAAGLQPCQFSTSSSSTVLTCNCMYMLLTGRKQKHACLQERHWHSRVHRSVWTQLHGSSSSSVSLLAVCRNRVGCGPCMHAETPFWQAVNSVQPDRHTQVSRIILCLPQYAGDRVMGSSSSVCLLCLSIRRVLSWLEHSASPYQRKHQAHRQAA
jgi:hypothetical protein